MKSPQLRSPEQPGESQPETSAHFYGATVAPTCLTGASPATALSLAHRQHLLGELGSDDAVQVAIDCGARSITPTEAAVLGYRYRGHVTGGLLLPFDGDFGQLRCDDPPIAPNGEGLKYLNRCGKPQSAVTFGNGDPTIATEGWKDALRLHLATGQTVQGIAGVTAHKRLASSVELLIYDADASDNPAVWSQLIAAGLHRSRLRLAFFPADLAGPKGGACEFFKAAAEGEFESIERFKARELIRLLPEQWDRNLRVDWQPLAMRHLARLAVLAGLNRDAVRQLVAGAAKGIGFPVDSARRIVTIEQHKQAPPPKPLPADAPPEAQLVSCAGAVPEWSANAGTWANALGAGVGDRLRMNLLSSRIEFDGRELRADAEELLYVRAQQAGWKVSKVDCFDGTREVARAHGFHPVREYLERVAGDPTLPTIDLDTIAARYLSVDDSLSAAMIRCKLIEAVARIYEPGCPSGGVVVLRGAQGIGKTEFWQALAGAFYVASRDTDNGKDQAMAMHRAWFYDFDELDKMTTAKQAASVRSTVSTNCDTFRPPYARRAETFPRQFVMVAAVNGDGFLTDKEGNRRFLVIDCPQRKDSGAFIDGPGAKRDRDAIWKAAVLAYRGGAQWRLTPAEQAASNVRNGEWEAVDEWETALAGWAEGTLTPGGFDTREAIVGANLRLLESISRADEMRASDALKRAGFVRTKHEVHRPGKPKARVWLPGGGDMDRPGQPGRPPLAQPEQPWRNLSDEVAPAETTSSASALPHLAHPTQPFLGYLAEERHKGLPLKGAHTLPSNKEGKKVAPVAPTPQTGCDTDDLGRRNPPTEPPTVAPEDGPSPGGLLTVREAVAGALRAMKLAATHPSAVRHVLQHLGAGYGRPAVTAAIEALRDEERDGDPDSIDQYLLDPTWR